MPKARFDLRGTTAKDGAAALAWQVLHSANPFKERSWQWYVYHYLTYHGIRFARAFDRVVAARCADNADLLDPTIRHWQSRLAGIKAMLQYIPSNKDIDPLPNNPESGPSEWLWEDASYGAN